jgi:hypothetical protein
MSVQRYESMEMCEKRKRRVVTIAMGEGIKYGLIGTVATTVIVIIASATNKSFKRFTSASAKVSFPIMAGLALFSYNFEVTLNNASLYPETWGVTEFIESGSSHVIPKHYKMVNYLYEHPLKTGFALCTPFVFTAVKQQVRLPSGHGLINSLRHSRGPIFAGFATLSISTVSLMQMKRSFGKLT